MDQGRKIEDECPESTMVFFGKAGWKAPRLGQMRPDVPRVDGPPMHAFMSPTSDIDDSDPPTHWWPLSTPLEDIVLPEA